MPDRRPPPVRLELSPRKNRPPKKAKSPRRPRGKRTAKGESRALYWTAGLLAVLLVALVVVYFETPEIKSWLARGNELANKLPATSAQVKSVENALPLPGGAPNQPVPAPAPAPPQPTAEELRKKKEQEALKEKAAQELKHEVVRTAPIPPPPPLKFDANGNPIFPPASPLPSQPPVAKPSPLAGAPARALPVDDKLTTERIAAYQVALERMHFSCGFIDGDQGMRTQRMLRAYQESRGLPLTGLLDPATRAAIGEPGEPFLTYTVTAADVDSIMPKPETWIAKSKAARLGYNDIWELLAEKFHCTRAYLKALNPGIARPEAGTEMIGPKVFPAAPIPHVASLRISLSNTSIEGLDANGRIVAFFPCSIARDKAKRPHGMLKVIVVDPHPDYTFDPALFADASKAEGITHKLTIPPGPRNPVGTTWVGLNLPGYGIHGTPDPEAISRTQSHGCFRLANWNAEKVLKMVRIGTPVDVVE